MKRCQVPLIRQQTRSECGIACLAMVAAFHGRRSALTELRRMAAGRRGLTLDGLAELGDRVGLAGRPVRLSLSECGRLRLPAVLHWQFRHYVVLTRATRRFADINDPASGRRRMTWPEVGRRFTGVALELLPRRDFEPSKERPNGIHALFSGVYDLRRYLLIMLVLLVVSQLLGVVPPVASQILIDGVSGQDRSWFPAALAGLGVVMLLTLLVDGFRGWLELFTGARLTADLTQQVVAHVFRLPVGFIEERHLGDVLSKIGSLAPIRQAISDDGVNAVVQLLVMLTTLVVMLLYSVPLTLVSLGGAIAIGIVTILLLPRLRRLSRSGLVHRAAEHSSILATLRAFRTVRHLGIAGVRFRHWQRSFDRGIDTSVREGKLGIARNLASGLVTSADQVAFLAIGVSGIVDRELTVGVLVAFMSLRARLAAALAAATVSIQRLLLLRVHVERLSDLMAAVPASAGGTLAKPIRGRLSLRDVSFAYADGPPILAAFSLDVPAGQHMVITGPSGCGKTTLLRLLAGQLAPDRGEVLVDGIERELYDAGTLCRAIGIVAETDRLFEGTVAENITAFDAAPNLARVRQAATGACIWDDILGMPMKIDTPIGDTGQALSGGQIQRLVLARALYRRPQILVLDEATSHLDVATESAVLDNIRSMNLTVVAVAHRPGAIARAARVVRLSRRSA